MTLLQFVEFGLAFIVLVLMPLRAYSGLLRRAPPMHPVWYVSETTCLLGVLTAIVVEERIPLVAIGMEVPIGLTGIIEICVCTAAIILADALAVAALRGSGASRRSSVPDNVVEDVEKRGNSIQFAGVSIVGACWEEFCFRAVGWYLCQQLHLGSTVAILLTSVLFALHHLRGGISSACYSGCFGLVFAIMYSFTNNLMAVIVAHASGNIFVKLYCIPRIRSLRAEEQVFV